MKTPGINPFEQPYIPSEIVIKKIIELAGYLSQSGKNAFLRSVDPVLEMANHQFPEPTTLNLVALSKFSRDHVSELGLKTPSPAFDQEYTKFLMGYMQLSKVGRQEVSAKIASLIDPDTSDIPDTIGGNFKP